MKDVEPNWVPLECLAQVATGAGLQLEPDDVMWVGGAFSSAGERIELSKHLDTRRCLNVDVGGHTYRYTDAGNEPSLAPAPAIVTCYERGLVWPISAGRTSTPDSCAPTCRATGSSAAGSMSYRSPTR